MSTPIILVSAMPELRASWSAQAPAGAAIYTIATVADWNKLPNLPSALVVFDVSQLGDIPDPWDIYTTIAVGEPTTTPFEHAKLRRGARMFLSYSESQSQLGRLYPAFIELSEQRSVISLLARKPVVPPQEKVNRDSTPIAAAELAELLEAGFDSFDNRDRLIAEFRRAYRFQLRATHVVFMTEDSGGYRADKGTSFIPDDDPLISYLRASPAILDGERWDSPPGPLVEFATVQRLGLLGCKLLVPIHEAGRIMGLVGLGVRQDGRIYSESDKQHAALLARLLRLFLSRCDMVNRLSAVSRNLLVGAKYFPATIVLGETETPPRNIPLAVRELIGAAKRSKQICRAYPTEEQPFRAFAGPAEEVGGVWAYWEEASSEWQDSAARETAIRKELFREFGLTIGHELGNALVTLATFRQSGVGRPLPANLVELMRRNIGDLEQLNSALSFMQGVHELESSDIDLRDLTQSIVKDLGLSNDVGIEQVRIRGSWRHLDYALRALIRGVIERRSTVSAGVADLSVKLRSSGLGRVIGLISIKGSNLELDGVLPEPNADSVPNSGRLDILLAKEILRLHNGDIHGGPGMETIEILISLAGI